MTISQIEAQLQTEGLLKKAQSHQSIFKKIIKECLDKNDEKILLLGDYGEENRRIAPMLSAAYYDAAQKLGSDIQFTIKDKQKSVSLRDAILSQKAESIIIANMSGKIGRLENNESTFREYCKKKGHKFISTMSLGKLENNHFDTIINTMDIDYKNLERVQQKIKSIIDEAKTIKVTTQNGTNLQIDITNTKALCANGSYTLKGSGGNMPGGEVYVAPKNVNGVVVIDASSRNRQGTTLIKEPIRLFIKNSEITKIEGGQEAVLLQESLSWAANRADDREVFGTKLISEFGIGTNPNARVIGSTVIDEKTLGTAHVAIGSNNWFGGDIRCNIHLDQVFHRPVIEIDGKEIKI